MVKQSKSGQKRVEMQLFIFLDFYANLDYKIEGVELEFWAKFS